MARLRDYAKVNVEEEIFLKVKERFNKESRDEDNILEQMYSNMFRFLLCRF